LEAGDERRSWAHTNAQNSRKHGKATRVVQ